MYWSSQEALPAAQTSAPLRRSGRSRTSRVRDDFIDADFLQYVSPTDEPLAFAEEVPAKKSPPPKTSTTKIVYDDADDRPIGPDYQATIPAWRPRPAQLTASEAKLLPAAPLYTPAYLLTPDQVGPASNTVAAAAAAAAFKAQYRAAPDGAIRRLLLAAAVEDLDRQMGPHLVKVLNLDRLGAKCASSWQLHEELLFCLGMCDKYRMFKYIRQCYLWSRSAHELNGYYHNVWKTRSTPEADEFLTLREEGASRAVMLVFVDKVRERLIAMWEQRKMGDMPKLLKDAAANAAIDAELEAEVDEMFHPEEEGDAPASPSTSCGTSTTDDSISLGEAAAHRHRPRRRTAAGAQATASSLQRPQRSTKQDRKQVAPVLLQSQPVAEALPTPTGTAALQQWLQPSAAGNESLLQAPQLQPLPSQPQQQQAAKQQSKRQRSQQKQQQQQQQQPVVVAPASEPTHQAAAAAAMAVPGTAMSGAALSSTGHVLKFPEMPLMPPPDVGDASASEVWLKALPGYHDVMSEYMQAVHAITDAAVLDYQQSINALQQQRSRLIAEADTYLRTLLAQGQKVLQGVNTCAATQQQQQQAVQAVNPVQFASLHAQQQQQPAQQVDTGNLQLAVQTLLQSHAKQKKQQQLQQQGAGQSSVQQASGAIKRPLELEQQQTQQAAQPSTGTADAALPFPLGPASQLLKGDAKRFKQEATAGADAAGEVLGCGGSSSEECELFVACTEAAVC